MSTSTQNPVIGPTGSATINSGQEATWETKSGSTGTLTINNPDRGNTLSIAITGAPSTGIIVQAGDKNPPTLNGFYEIPPNTPSFVVKAVGDFLGQNVKIINNTNPQNDAPANIQALTN